MNHATDEASEPTLPIHPQEPARDIVPHAGWREARRRATEALGAGARTIAVIGVAGTGKSLLLADLADMLRTRHRDVRLLRTVHELDPADAVDPETIVLLDEADRATDAELAAVLGRGTRILAGLPPLLRRLEALGQAAAVVHLTPLDREEVPGFLAARLASAGYPPDLLEPGAVEELTARSGGVPRLLNVLTAAAAFAASLEESPHVTARHVAEAARHAAGSARNSPLPVARDPDEVTAPWSGSEFPDEAVTEPTPTDRFPDEAPNRTPPENPSRSNRTHLVEAAARWAGAAWPVPGEVIGAQAVPGNDLTQTSQVAPTPDASPPMADPEPVRAQPAITPPQPAVVPSVPLEADALPPESEMAAKARTTGRPPAQREAGREAEAAPSRIEGSPSAPAQDDALPRRRRWAYAAAALLVLGGAGLALVRGGDRAPSSPPAPTEPASARLAERAGNESSTPAVPVAAPGAAPTAPPAPDPAPNGGQIRAAEAGTGASAPQMAAPTTVEGPATPPPEIPSPVPAPETPPPGAVGPAVPLQAALPVTPEPATPEPVDTAPQAVPDEAPQAAPPPLAPPPAAAAAPANAAPAEEPPAAAEQAPPSAPPPRIFVYLLPNAARDARSERLVADLSSRFPEVASRRASNGPRFAVVRHFFAADASSAEAVAATLSAAGTELRVQDFSSYRPQPRPGTIEVWLP